MSESNANGSSTTTPGPNRVGPVVGGAGAGRRPGVGRRSGEGRPRPRGRVAVLAVAMLAAVVGVTGLTASPALAASPPVTRRDVARTNLNTAVAVNVTANDFDPDGSAVSLQNVTTPPNGTVSFSVGGSSITYTPTTGFTGLSTIT